MSRFTRRDFLRIAGAASTASIWTSPADAADKKTAAKKSAQVVVIGGGFAGATCAKYLKAADPSITVTLIEPEKKYVTGPLSNHVVAGVRKIENISIGYDGLRKRGVQVLHDWATAIDPGKRRVALKSGKSLAYDKLVVAPGIELKWGAIKHYTDVAAVAMPHAWKAGSQTLRLRDQLAKMRNGGTFIITAPQNPYRCPPGPYERASLVAHYFKRNKPKSKILILDAKDAFSKQALFLDAWKQLYGNMIEWIPSSKGGIVTAVNTSRMQLDTETGVKYRGDVINIVPPQTAGSIARMARLTDDKGWCPVNPLTFESKKFKNIFVIGDSAVAGALPKSAFAANSEAKIAANAIVAELQGQAPAEASYINTCYSLVAPDYGISIAGVYRVTAEGISEIPGAGGESPKDADAHFRADEAKYALGWYASIVADIWS